MSTGYVTFNSCTALSTFAVTFSKPNSGACTPITTRPWFLYFDAQLSRYGSCLSELMHEYVQTSTTTTFPRSDLVVNGAELSQPVAPSNGASALRPRAAAGGGPRSPPR